MSERPPCSQAECETLVDRFLPPIDEFPDEVRTALEGTPVPSDRRTIERLGCCLWDIFSHNHDVVTDDGRAYHLGSFRGTGDFLADRVEVRYPDVPGFDYVDFYMGTRGVDGPAVVYEWIFRGLTAAGCDWIYAFPRIQVLKLGDPSPVAGPASLAAEPSLRDFADSLDRAHEESVRKARERPLPATVAAYRAVYGRLPEGWPHRDM